MPLSQTSTTIHLSNIEGHMWVDSSRRIHIQNRFIQVESGIESGSVEKLKEMGHLVESKLPSSARLYFGGVHAALMRSENSELEGGADPRRDGAALGH